MALITCPECGGKVSDRAAACIHCGYPLQEQKAVLAENSNLKRVVLPPPAEWAKYKISGIKVVRDVTGLGLADAKELAEKDCPVVKDGLTQTEAEAIVLEFQKIGIAATIQDSSSPVAAAKTTQAGIRCPKCGSTEYHAGARGFSLITGFIGSGQTVLTCLKCGYRWKPGR